MYSFVYVLCLAVIFPISAHASSSIAKTSCSVGITRELVDGSSFLCACNSSTPGIQSSINIISSWSTLNYSNANAINVNQAYSSKENRNSVYETNQTASGVLTFNSGSNISLGNTNGVILQLSDNPLTPRGSIVISSGLGGLATNSGNNVYKQPLLLSAVPEPSTFFMVLLGLGLITCRRQVMHKNTCP